LEEKVGHELSDVSTIW